MKKKYHIFHNSTVERFFSAFDASYSGYNDISSIPESADAYVWFYLSPIKTNADMYIREIEVYTQQLQFVLSQIQPFKACYAFTLHDMHYIYHETGNLSINEAIGNYNYKLCELSEAYPNLKIIDFARFCRLYPSSELIDLKYYYISQMLLTPKLADDFDRWIRQEFAAIEGKRKKCLVLDLDNTLWGGILGEDGPENIQIGHTYPGSAFLDFQNNLLELSKNGIILTVCSKNNEQEVLEVWDKNPFLSIKKQQLAAWRINWNNKADNLAELAQELNIGLDSMVLIDDSPAERALVKQMHPLVETPEFPKQPYQLPAFFETLCRNYFQIYKLTTEDKARSEQYKANTERITFKKSFTSFEDYLKSLEIELTISELNPMNLSRIAQLTQKTNQFNLTTKRYTEEDLRALTTPAVIATNEAARQGAKVYCLSVKDKFGDNGITGVAIITTGKNPKTATIDSFLLSCRILGRHIENVFLKYVLLQLKNAGYNQITASFMPTLKNSQVSDFYDLNGFHADVPSASFPEYPYPENKNYSCSLHELDLSIPTIYKINS